MNDIDELMNENIRIAINGREVWNRILQHYSINYQQRAWVFPKADEELYSISQKYLDDFIKKYELERLLIILTEDFRFYSDTLCAIYNVVISKEDAEALIKLYELSRFSNLLYIISMDIPEGRCGNKVIYRQNNTVDEVIKYGILGFDPVYDGD